MMSKPGRKSDRISVRQIYSAKINVLKKLPPVEIVFLSDLLIMKNTIWGCY